MKEFVNAGNGFYSLHNNSHVSLSSKTYREVQGGSLHRSSSAAARSRCTSSTPTHPITQGSRTSWSTTSSTTSSTTRTGKNILMESENIDGLNFHNLDRNRSLDGRMITERARRLHFGRPHDSCAVESRAHQTAKASGSMAAEGNLTPTHTVVETRSLKRSETELTHSQSDQWNAAPVPVRHRDREQLPDDPRRQDARRRDGEVRPLQTLARGFRLRPGSGDLASCAMARRFTGPGSAPAGTTGTSPTGHSTKCDAATSSPSSTSAISVCPTGSEISRIPIFPRCSANTPAPSPSDTRGCSCTRRSTRCTSAPMFSAFTAGGTSG